MFDLIRLFVICGTLLLGTFLVLLALPKCQLRGFVLEACGWALAALSALYIASPIDLLPDFIPVLGQIDDAGALVGGIAAAITAIMARKSRNKGNAET